jgi:glycosyltransferase involved in cell wall biosynthesis
MPLISVIIPLYNSEKTIRQTIESVLNQTFDDFELIVVDDGSTDSSLAIVCSITDPRLKVFSYPNAGACVARNRGFTHATGEFIAFLDADDQWTVDKLADQLAALRANPEAAVAYSWTTYVSESGKVIHTGHRVTVSDRQSAYTQLLIFNFLENGSNPLIQRSALAEVGGFDESLQGSQDRDLYLRLAARYAFATVPKQQILYRMSSNSISANISRQEAQCLQFLDRAYAQAPDSVQYLKRQSLAHLYKYLMFRGLEGRLTPRKSLQVARLFYCAIRYNPNLIQQHQRLMLIVCLKLIAGLLIPPFFMKVPLNKAFAQFKLLAAEKT